MLTHLSGRGLAIVRNAVAVFLFVSLVLVAAIFVVTNAVVGRAAEQTALAEAESVTQSFVNATLTDNLRQGLLNGRVSSVDKFLRRVGGGSTFNESGIASFDILRADGFLAFDSRDPGAASEEHYYALTEEQEEVLRTGDTSSSLADPQSRRSIDRPGEEAGLVKVSARVLAGRTETQGDTAGNRGQSTEPVPALFVAYWDLEEVEKRRASIFGNFRWITLGPLVILALVSSAMLAVLTQQIRSGSRDRERLLQTAIDASDAERRRIARDLHDGVVQDLAGSAFALSGAARDPAITPATSSVLTSVSTSMRDSLKQMRSLLAEIHPPDLHGQGLEAALDDLIAPAAAAGIHASVSVTGVEGATDAEVSLLWRVAQEAVRNATRHSGASTLAVTVRGTADELLLEVVDDGIGFDTSAPSEPDRFGLRGLRSLVRDVGGDLDVISAVGEGTSVRMAVRR